MNSTEAAPEYMTRDQLVATSAVRRYVDAPLPDGRKVRLQSLTELERQQADLGGPPEQLTARYIVRCLVDHQGRRMFADEQLAEVLAMDAELTIQLDQAILKHVGMSNIELTGKNSPATPDDSLQST